MAQEGMTDLAIPDDVTAGLFDPKPAYVVLRPLTDADKARADAGELVRAPHPDSAIKRLRDRHHWIAQLVATETPIEDVSAITGMSVSRIRLLGGDPAFAELVAHYTAQAGKAGYVGTSERLSYLGATMADDMLERMEEAPETVSNRDIGNWAELVLDRSGHGKTTTLNVNSTDRVQLLKEMKSRATITSVTEVVSREEYVTSIALESPDPDPVPVQRQAAVRDGEGRPPDNCAEGPALREISGPAPG